MTHLVVLNHVNTYSVQEDYLLIQKMNPINPNLEMMTIRRHVDSTQPEVDVVEENSALIWVEEKVAVVVVEVEVEVEEVVGEIFVMILFQVVIAQIDRKVAIEVVVEVVVKGLSEVIWEEESQTLRKRMKK